MPTKQPDYDRATGRSLSAAVDRGTRVAVAGSLAISLLLLALLGWFTLVSQPTIVLYERGLLALQDGHAAMLDQETGLRGFLTTGDLSYLQPYTAGRGELARANGRMLGITSDPRLTRSVVTVQLTQQLWTDNWAMPAASGEQSTPSSTTARDDFLRAGKVEFDRYRAAQLDAVRLTRDSLHQARKRQQIALSGALGTALLVAGITVAVSVRRRNALRRDVIAPVDALLQGLDDVSQGRLEGKVCSPGPRELLDVIDGFNQMTGALLVASTAAAEREELIATQAMRLQGVLSMVREIGGSLNLKYVLISITEAASSISGIERVVVWLVGENQTSVEPRWDSVDGATVTSSAIDLGVGVVGRAAKYGRASHGNSLGDETGASLAVPLVVGARIIGVLELALTAGQQLPDDQIEVIETLSIHAATAIEAARLHEGASHASEHDALTRLPNRRRLEADLISECERSLRYARPLSFLMLDLDHFKAINDTYGHARGDDVLQEVAALISELLRTTDTAYRYGGEEIAVIVRESNSAAAQVLAERLRSRIQATFSGPGETGVTASIGIASMPADAATPQALVAAADAAMYLAKHQGRNRVVVASAPKVLVNHQRISD